MKRVYMAAMLTAPVGLWGHVCRDRGFVARYTPNWPVFLHLRQRRDG